MYNIPTYDHSKPEVRDDSGPSFFHRAAQISIWAPILGILFAKGMTNALDGEHGRWATIAQLATGGLVGFAFVASFVLGIIALCGMGAHGTGGILVKSICGIILSALLLAIMGAGFIHGFEEGLKKSRENRAALDRLEETSREVAAQQKTEFNRHHGITLDSTQPKIDKLKSALDDAAAASPDMALAAKAGKSFLTEMQALMTDYSMAENKLIGPPSIFDVSGLTQREQLQIRRKNVEGFLAANDRLLTFVTKKEAIFRAELTQFQVPTATAESALASFRVSAARRTPIEMEIRKSDQRLGAAVLSMLDVLDNNWDNWSYDQQRKKPVFTSPDALQKYNASIMAARAAAADQQRLQAQLVNLPDVAANR